MTHAFGSRPLPFVGVLLAAAIAFAPVPAWSADEAASGASIIVAAEDEGLIISTGADTMKEVSADAPTAPTGSASEKDIVHAEAATLIAEETAEIKDDIGFPQLNTDTYASQVFWLLVSFALMYALMSKVALPRIGEVIDMRQSQRDGNLGRAEQLNNEAEKIREQYEATLSDARGKAEDHIRSKEQDISEKVSAETSRFGEQARKRIVTAEQEILKAKTDALASIADISTDIACDIVIKVSGVQVNKADAKKIVAAEMQKG